MRRVPIVLAALLAATPLSAQNAVEPHVRALLQSAPATPGQRGYLDVAMTEVAIARRHAQAAMVQQDLAAIKAETAAALHAIDPTLVPQGPGLGYGLRNALAHSVVEIMRSQRSSAPEDEAGLRAAAASVAAQTALERTDEATRTARAILLAGDVQSARALLPAFDRQLATIRAGQDLDGDGEVVWNKGEGGIQQAWSITRQMAIAEGMQVAER